MELNYKVFDQFPTLHTKRLVLRQVQMNDAQQIFDNRNNQRISAFIPNREMESLKDAEELVEKLQDGFKKMESLAWFGTIKGSDKMIGSCGYNRIEYQNLRAEIGGELNVEYWGTGIALEAIKEVIRFGFEELKLHSIEAKVNPDNRSTIYLMGLLGFEKEAHFKEFGMMNGEFKDLAVYSLLANSWKTP